MSEFELLEVVKGLHPNVQMRTKLQGF